MPKKYLVRWSYAVGLKPSHPDVQGGEGEWEAENADAVYTQMQKSFVDELGDLFNPKLLSVSVIDIAASKRQEVIEYLQSLSPADRESLIAELGAQP